MELSSGYSFWVNIKNPQKENENYESNLQKIADFETVDKFWQIY